MHSIPFTLPNLRRALSRRSLARTIAGFAFAIATALPALGPAVPAAAAGAVTTWVLSDAQGNLLGTFSGENSLGTVMTVTLPSGRGTTVTVQAPSVTLTNGLATQTLRLLYQGEQSGQLYTGGMTLAGYDAQGHFVTGYQLSDALLFKFQIGGSATYPGRVPVSTVVIGYDSAAVINPAGGS